MTFKIQLPNLPLLLVITTVSSTLALTSTFWQQDRERAIAPL
ncbi:hypothetical protein [Oscillatoria sp. FACHB-1406]|nr:hypothetical protein [Oscillatoria sp. FACHB-1406]